MELIEPTKYTGFGDYRANDWERKTVIKATITPTKITSGYDINIYFEDGTKYYDWSDSVRGCKQIFAFHCKKGSKWRV